MYRLLCLLVFAFLVPLTLKAQETGQPLRVFLDCQNVNCDFDYFRTEVAFVSYVRNREDSDVHVIVTDQENGSGGETYTLRFIGQKRFAGVEDELSVATSQTSTDDERRKALVRVFKAGLVRYLARTDALSRLSLSYEAPAATDTAPVPVRDPWNYWVFRSNLRGFFNGEKSYSSTYLNGSLSAQRTTEVWKSEARAYYNLDRNVFRIDETTSTTQRQRSYGGNTLLVRSLSDHWSVGGRTSLYASDYDNTQLKAQVAPAVEFSVFPYSQSTRRAVRLLYTLGAAFVDYQEETIFFKETETLFSQSVEGSVAYQQPWGSLRLSLEGAHYLHDIEKYRLDVSGNADLRLIRGLSLNFYGGASRIRDQIELRRSGASDEDVLLRRRALETGYRYFLSAGVSYTFGSIYNNVVNPRF